MGAFDELLSEPLPQRAVQFFQVFSRFECAMKRSGVYADGGEKEVKADWDKLAVDLGDDFLREVIESGIAPALLQKPPKKQIKLPNDSLGWREMGSISNTLDLFLAIRRARNNLIHGGKYQDGGGGHTDIVDGSERDDVLLRESLNVLALAYERSPPIRQSFGRV